MVGGLFAANGNSCTCVAGYVWNTTLLKCVCDYQQNFYIVGGICYDCITVANSNGFATINGCIC